jgi:hypothetical protein
MPTYDFRCPACGAEQSAFLTMGEYLRAPPGFVCCGQSMERDFRVAAGLAVHNPLAGDRAYAGLRASDGTDVSTRTKHRAYMKEHGLTTADDYRGEWQRAAQARAATMSGEDPTRREDLARAAAKLAR